MATQDKKKHSEMTGTQDTFDDQPVVIGYKNKRWVRPKEMTPRERWDWMRSQLVSYMANGKVAVNSNCHDLIDVWCKLRTANCDSLRHRQSNFTPDARSRMRVYPLS